MMKEEKLIRDFPMGVLVMVIAQFPLAGMYYLVGPQPFWLVPLLVLLSVVYYVLFNVGWRIAVVGVKDVE